MAPISPWAGPVLNLEPANLRTLKVKQAVLKMQGSTDHAIGPAGPSEKLVPRRSYSLAGLGRRRARVMRLQPKLRPPLGAVDVMALVSVGRAHQRRPVRHSPT